MRKRPVGFWSSAKVQSVMRLAVEGKLAWDAAAKRINAMTPGISALDAARVQWRGTHAKSKVRREIRRKSQG